MSIALSLATLADLPANAPSYSRSDLTAGIMHFGIGNFHRAHQAVYLDELFSLGLDHDWAIVGAGVRASDAKMRQKLQQQDWLTTVVQRDAMVQSARITGVMIDYIKPNKTTHILNKLADPAIRIVSLTITEGGYFIDPASGKFDPTHPEIMHDARNINAPKTVFGLILAGLLARRDAGIAPFTIMSCDNIPGNGHVTADAVVGLAELLDQDLAKWVRENVAFPNSMVDRITPATTDEERLLVSEQYGIKDNWPVTCETFKQWVVEDNFPAGRPALEKVGVKFVKNAEPYETMKIRILNGGHAAIAYPAGLLDIHYAHEAMQNKLVSGFLSKLVADEIIPVVPPIPDVDLSIYFEQVAERFTNPNVCDTVTRLCFDGSNRQPKFILPSVHERLERNQDVTGLALVSAFWCRYCSGETESGAAIAPNDPNWSRLQTHALDAIVDPSAFLAMDEIFGSLANSSAYVHAFSKALTTIWSEGTTKTIERYLAGGF